VRFVARDVADLLDRLRRRIPLYLYDNADIAADPSVPHLRTRQVKALSRLDFVRGIKVTARRKVLGDYMLAARDFGERGAFGLYMGNAHLIFQIFRPREGPLSAAYQRWRLRGGLPVGVVAGPANVLPREWARAWQVCRAGDAERMDAVEEVLDTWRDATRRTGAGIACIKRALRTLGVVSSDCVAPGTPRLEPAEGERFDEAFEAVRQLARQRIGEPWVSEPMA
jgi:dihydrodipicolinate synthase/N-acetylneuraminate lyase